MFECDLDSIIQNENGGWSIPRYFEYSPMPVREEEMLRYSGIPLEIARKKREELPENILQGKDKAISLIKGQLVYKVGYMTGPLLWDEEGYPVLPFAQKSDILKKNLKNCRAVVLFAATIGSGIDRLIRRYEVAEPAVGALLQGLGAERAETLADTFNEEVTNEAERQGMKTHPRFSPGFGDLPLTVQREFLDSLDAGRRMGITLNESCLMAPSKSVTAVIGIEQFKEEL